MLAIGRFDRDWLDAADRRAWDADVELEALLARALGVHRANVAIGRVDVDDDAKGLRLDTTVLGPEDVAAIERRVYGLPIDNPLPELHAQLNEARGSRWLTQAEIDALQNAL